MDRGSPHLSARTEKSLGWNVWCRRRARHDPGDQFPDHAAETRFKFLSTSGCGMIGFIRHGVVAAENMMDCAKQTKNLLFEVIQGKNPTHPQFQCRCLQCPKETPFLTQSPAPDALAIKDHIPEILTLLEGGSLPTKEELSPRELHVQEAIKSIATIWQGQLISAGCPHGPVKITLTVQKGQ